MSTAEKDPLGQLKNILPKGCCLLPEHGQLSIWKFTKHSYYEDLEMFSIASLAMLTTPPFILVPLAMFGLISSQDGSQFTKARKVPLFNARGATN